MQRLKEIVILGGGTAGWMMSAALAKKCNGCDIRITLVESESIGTVGVGESTIPHIRDFNKFLGIDETSFLKKTKATFKVGIVFENWGDLGESYIHPFGAAGCDIEGVEFQHYWARFGQYTKAVNLDRYSLASTAIRENKFEYPSGKQTGCMGYNYAFHFDAALYAKFLRDFATQRGVRRVEGKMAGISMSNEVGAIESLILDTGEIISGDFFIDCTGFRALLIGQAMSVPFESWQEWLPCDRAVALPCSREGNIVPYTRATAHRAGWCWRIPLQHRTGNGCVYSSDHMSKDEALGLLLSQIDGEPLADPKFFQFTAGMRREQWKKNCVAIGLAGGFLEPLESTSIYLIQVGIQNFLQLFSVHGYSQILADEFNRRLAKEYIRIRDFIIMHYWATRRSDSLFWKNCQAMTVPASLSRRLGVFKSSGHIDHRQYGVFSAVCVGQGVVPECVDPRAKLYSQEEFVNYANSLSQVIETSVAAMPLAQCFVDRLLNE